MQGFKNTTKTVMDHQFPQTSVQVPAHSRAMPVRKPAPQMGSDAPITDAVPPSGALTTGLSPTGYAPRHPRITLSGAGKRGLRKPRTSQLEATNGDEPGFAKGGHIDAATRKGLPKSDFGLPGERKYPIPDKAHAANAKARATQQVDKGNLSPSAKARIDAKANAVLGKARGGSVRDPRSPMISRKPGC